MRKLLQRLTRNCKQPKPDPQPMRYHVKTGEATYSFRFPEPAKPNPLDSEHFTFLGGIKED